MRGLVLAYEYVVKVRDFIRGMVIDSETFTDANTAYQVYRTLSDRYKSSEDIEVILIEPNY